MANRLAVLAIVAWAAIVELTLRVIPPCEVAFAGWILRLVEVCVALEVAAIVDLRRDRIPRARVV